MSSGKHHSSQNLKKQTRRPLCQRDTHINSAVSSVRWKRHQRPSLAIAWIPANGLCDIQTVTDGYEMKGALSLVFHQNDSSFSPGPPNWCPLCGATYFGFLWPTVLPPLASSSGMAPKTKEPSFAWYGSPSALTPPGTSIFNIQYASITSGLTDKLTVTRFDARCNGKSAQLVGLDDDDAF